MDSKEFSITEVIDSFGISKHTWFMFILLSIANVFDGYDFMVVNSTNLFVAHTFWPGEATPGVLMGSLTTWGLLGMVVGGAISGIMSDKYGRKKTLIGFTFLYGVFTLPQAFASNLAFFATFRVLAGLGVGACVPIVYTVFSECVPSKWRGAFITAGGAFMVGGWVLAGVIANPICNAAAPLLGDFTNLVAYATPDGGTATMYANWRLCYLIGGIPIIYAIILHFVMNETPHWYASVGRAEDAVKTLAIIEKKSIGTVTERDAKLLIVPPRPEKTTPKALFSNKYIVGTCGVWAVYFITMFCVYSMNAWIPAWFVSVGYTSSQAVALQTWNNAAAIVANTVVGIASDTVGRKKSLLIGWVMCILVVIACSLFVAPNSYMLCMGLMLLFGFALNWTISAVVPLIPEQYPTALRNTGIAWCYAFARFGGSASSIVLGGIAGMAVFQSATGATNWSQVILVMIVPFALGIICTALLVKDAGKQSFEELDAAATQEEEVGKDPSIARFAIMGVLVAILIALCIVCPLVVPGWSKLPVALPLMSVGMLLPFVFFFIYGLKGFAKKNSN